jgi:sulfite exporter TauE/SafE
MDTINLFSIISIAFLGSFGHCIGMCGGIVVAYSSTKIKDDFSKAKQIYSHLAYSMGRISTYVLLGAMFGYFGGVVSFSNTSNGILWIIVGVTMILTGLSLLGKINFLNIFEKSISTTTWYKKSFTQLFQNNTSFSFYLLGMLNGLLPCGLVYFFAITAASTTSAFYGALVMFIFGLSTVPALFSIGYFVSLIKKLKLRNTLMKLSAILIISYGVFTIYNGYNYLVNPQRTVLQCH